MEKEYINFMNMIDALMSDFNSSKQLWETKAPISNAVNTIEGCRIEVSAKSFDQTNTQTKGTTADMNMRFSKLTRFRYWYSA